MGSTPRDRLTQIPMPTRSTEANEVCQGRTVLSYLRAEDQRPASYFILGDVLHRTIEHAINEDLDFDAASDLCDLILSAEVSQVRDQPVLSGSARSMESIFEDAERMLINWYAHVHPDSDKRHPVYDDYAWPPKTEVPFYNTTLGTRYPVWGSIDTVFTRKLNRPVALHRIVDWKSGVKKPDSDFQLNFYRLGSGLVGADAHYHMLDRIRKNSIVVEAEPYPGNTPILMAIEVTEELKEQTIKGVMPTFNPGWQCGYCPVQHVCPVDGDPRNRKRNERRLQRLLDKAEKMSSIPGVA